MLFQMMTGLECGHSYCTSCWTEYLSTKIMDEGVQTFNFTKINNQYIIIIFFREMKSCNMYIINYVFLQVRVKW